MQVQGKQKNFCKKIREKKVKKNFDLSLMLTENCYFISTSVRRKPKY